MRIRPESILYTVLLGALSALPPLSIDMGLPGFPSMEAGLSGASGKGSLTLSLFLLGFAVSPLAAGQLADRYGRKNLILSGTLLFAISAFACSRAGSFDFLLGFRLLQGFAAGACVVVPLAIVRDVFDGAVAKTKLAQIATVLGIAPLAAPVLGGWMMSFADWRSIYLAQAILGILIFGVTATGFRETFPIAKRATLQFSQVVRTYKTVLANHQFRNYTLIYALGFACMFTYISAAPSVFMSQFLLSPQSFSLIFGLTSCGMLLGALLSGALSKRGYESGHMVTVATSALLCCAGILTLLAKFNLITAWSVAPFATLSIFSFGFLAPSANFEAMKPLPDSAGAASGISGSAQMSFGAIASAMTAFLLPLTSASLVMASVMLFCSFSAWLLNRSVQRIA